MREVTFQLVDRALVERIESLARQRQWSVSDVLLQALRDGLGISAAQNFSESRREPRLLATLDGQWDSNEKGVFEEALRALSRTQPTQLAPESIRADEPEPGAE